MTKKKTTKKSSSNQKSTKSSSAKGSNQRAERSESDIIQLILKDHKPIKALLETLKDPEISFEQRQADFEQFVPTLLTHAEAEQNTLYVHMKEFEELCVESFEGDTEHAMASQLIEEIQNVANEDEWTAKVKVLAEIVEHHIEEEESEMLKEVKKEISEEQRAQIGQEYVDFKKSYEMDSRVGMESTERPTPARAS